MNCQSLVIWNFQRRKKSTRRQRSGKGTIRKRLPLQNQGGKKPNQQSGTYTMKTFRKPNEQLFSQKVAIQLP